MSCRAATNVGTLTRVWTSTAGNPYTSPVIDGTSVFAAGPDGVTAYSLPDGAPRWTTMAPDPTYGSFSFRNLTIDETGLVVPYGFVAGGGFSTRDKATGTELSGIGGFHQVAAGSKAVRADAAAYVTGSYGSGGPLITVLHYADKTAITSCCDFSTPQPTEPSIVGRFVIIGVGTSVQAYSLDTCASAPSGTGCAPDWSVNLGSTVSTPVGIDGTRVAVATATGDIKILDVATGAVVFTADLPTATTTIPAVGPTSIYAGGPDGKVYAIPKAGCGGAICTPTWSVDTGTGTAISHQPAIGADVVYAGTANGKVVALSTACNTSTCAPLWTGTVSDSTAAPVKGIALQNGSIVATTSTGPVGTIARFHRP